MKKALCSVILGFLLIIVIFKTSAYSQDEADFIFKHESHIGLKTIWLSITDSKGSYLWSAPNVRVAPQYFALTEEKKVQLINYINSTNFFSLDETDEEKECQLKKRESLSIKIHEKYNEVSIRCLDDKRYQTVIAIMRKTYEIIGNRITAVSQGYREPRPKIIPRAIKLKPKPRPKKHYVIKAGKKTIKKNRPLTTKARKIPVKKKIPITKTSRKIPVKNKNLLIKTPKKKVIAVPSVKKQRKKTHPQNPKPPIFSRLIQFFKELIGY